MLLYRLFQACGMDRDFLRFLCRLPLRVQRWLGLVPVFVSER